MTRMPTMVFALLLVAAPAAAEEGAGRTLGPVTMEWEQDPVDPPPRAWIGGGLTMSSDALTHGGAPWGAGVDFSWLTHTQTVHHVLRFSHRTWRAPTPAVEDRLRGRGVSEGVQSYWAGQMVLSSLTKFIRPHKQDRHLGMQGGWLLQRTQHVGMKTHRYLLREHNLSWGPLWAVHFGAQLHAGLYQGEENFRFTGYFKALDPVAARLNRRDEGIVLDGKLMDPIETVAPEAELGLSMGGRMDPYFLSLNVGMRMIGTSVVELGSGQEGWARMLVGDLSVSKAF